MTVPTSSQLEYEPAKRVLRRRRWRRAVAAFMVLVGVVSLWRAGPPFLRQVRYFYWQTRCARFAEPSNFVAYEEDATRGAALLPRAGYFPMPTLGGPTPPATLFSPPPLTALQNKPSGAVFLHERTMPSGRRRIVIVFPNVGPPIGNVFRGAGRIVEFQSHTAVPATLLPGSELRPLGKSRLCLILQPDDVLRLFWGQPDPRQSDHFTIGYELNGAVGTIDGRLKDDGQLDLSVRDGPAKKVAATLPY
jgi:hypothetical protein